MKVKVMNVPSNLAIDNNRQLSHSCQELVFFVTTKNHNLWPNRASNCFRHHRKLQPLAETNFFLCMHREIHFCFWAKHICQILKGRWWISHFRCWTHPEVVNLGADQTDRSVLRWECRMQNNVLTSVCDSSYENTSYPPKCFSGVWGHSESLWKPFWNALQCFSNPFETLWNPLETLWNCSVTLLTRYETL